MPFQLRRSSLGDITQPNSFFWGTGIEDTFITAPWPTTGRILDEYELTEHYTRWREDIDLVAALGVQTARYGIPWHKINPQRGAWDWDWTDRALEYMLEVGVQPIVDLVHYGLPAWIDRAYLNPDFPEFMAEYASRVAERFKGRIFAYTPLNEPRITAWYCGRIGWWPPHERSWRGFLAVLQGACRGIVRTVEALHAVDPEIVPVHVDATDRYSTVDSTLQEEVNFRQEIVFLSLDLITGKVGTAHSLYDWALRNGMAEADMSWFRAHAVEVPLLGLNLYPMFTDKNLLRDSAGRTRIQMKYSSGELIEHLGRLYWERYRAPLFISETASVGSVGKRMAWLHDSLGATRRAREAGIPIVGYTWWPLFALVTWAYRQGTKSVPEYLKQMGLWDLDESLERCPTPLIEAYRKYVQAGSGKVGYLPPLTSRAL